MYSTPIVRAYASRSTPRMSRSGMTLRRAAAPRPPVGNSRSRSQIVRSWCVMSSSGCVSRLRRPERVEVGDEVAAHAVHVDELRAPARPSRAASTGSVERAAVGDPARRLVRHAEAREDVVVEVVARRAAGRGCAREELAALGALDDAVVVGARERHDLAHAELGERLRVGALVLGRVADRADADDEALARHQPRHRVHGADRARVRDRARWCRRSRRARACRCAPCAMSSSYACAERRRSRACRRP